MWKLSHWIAIQLPFPAMYYSTERSKVKTPLMNDPWDPLPPLPLTLPRCSLPISFPSLPSLLPPSYHEDHSNQASGCRFSIKGSRVSVRRIRCPSHVGWSIPSLLYSICSRKINKIRAFCREFATILRRIVVSLFELKVEIVFEAFDVN